MSLSATPFPSPTNIFLVGLMGVGKTSIGQHLAKILQKRFIDSDHEIEARTGVSIQTIFEIEGEAGFRQRESSLLHELVHQQDIVLATGGGIVIWDANRALLKQHGFVIYLRAEVNELVARTRFDKGRPLLQTDDPYQRLVTLQSERDPLYREIANWVIDTGHESLKIITEKLAQALQDPSQSHISITPLN